MASEIFSARESSVNEVNSVGSTASARRQANPFRNITGYQTSAFMRQHLESEGVNMRLYDAMRREQRNNRIDYEYGKQVDKLRDSLREKYPMSEWADRSFTTDRGLMAEAKAQRAAYNREFNQGVRRLRRLAAAAKKK